MVATCAAFGCTNSRKIAQGWVFTRLLLLILKTNYFDRDGYKTFIAQIPCQRMKTFMFVRTISKKIASNDTLRCVIWNLYFECASAIFLTALNSYRQHFLPRSVRGKTILPLQLTISALAFSLPQPGINNLSNLSQSLHIQSFLPALFSG